MFSSVRQGNEDAAPRTSGHIAGHRQTVNGWLPKTESRRKRGANRQTDLIDLRSRPVETGAQSPPHGRIPCSPTKGYSVMTSKQIILAAAMAFVAVPASAAGSGNGSDQKSDKNAAAVDNKKY